MKKAILVLSLIFSGVVQAAPLYSLTCVEASQKDEKGDDKYTAGKLNLVDLAGSERQSKTQVKT